MATPNLHVLSLMENPVAKISYVQGYAPWGWIVGSGIYIDDVNAIFKEQVIKNGVVTSVLTAPGCNETILMFFGKDGAKCLVK